MNFSPVSLPDGEDFLYRPVLAGHLDALALDDGRATIDQIAALNDALDVKDENASRCYAASKAKR